MSGLRNVLVVGGGIGGLTAATAFRRRGVAVDLIERNPDHSVYGVGIIQPNNTLRALDAIGLADECVARGGAFPGWRIFDRTGAHLMDAPAGRDAAPHLPAINGITRPILQDILLAAATAAGASIRTGVRIAQWNDEGDQVAVGFSDGGDGRYDLVVGADGIHSTLRRELFPNADAPRYSGQSVWRYNFERPPEVEWGAVYYGRRTKVGLVPMSPSQMYMFVVSEEPGNPRMPERGSAAAMRERIADFQGLVAGLREQIVDDAGVVYKPMEHLLLPSPWHRCREVLIGDAAHATTPHLAQGAAMAIEDAVLLAEVATRAEPLEASFAEFMRRRFDRAAYVVHTSSRIAEWELESWAGIENPDADPGRLLGEASHRLLETY